MVLVVVEDNISSRIDGCGCGGTSSSSSSGSKIIITLFLFVTLIEVEAEDVNKSFAKVNARIQILT